MEQDIQSRNFNLVSLPADASVTLDRQQIERLLDHPDFVADEVATQFAAQ